MNTSKIINAINSDFAATYRGAARFVNSGELWDFCMDTIGDPIALSNIVFANDIGVPPVKSLLMIYRRKVKPADGFEFSDKESKAMGALMGFVFKFCLGYKSQKDRCAVNDLGVKTAARFMDGPATNFEK